MDFPTLEMLPATRLFLALLLHFVWQATLAIGLVAIGRSLIHPKYCQVRYVLSVVGLVAVLLLPLATFAYYALNTAATQALFSISTNAETASIAAASAPSLIGQFEALFQVVFGWFDNHRFFWLGGWLIGFTLLVLRLTVSLGHCIRIRRSQKPLPPRLQELADRLKSKLGLTQKIIIGVSQEITQAVATGIIRPVVLIPTAWVTQLPISAIEAVLAHELAHVKRWDLWINFLQRFAETVFFFHPLVWWLSQKISNEREVCCDQLAVRITGQPMRYVETLAYVAGNKNLDEFEFQFGTAFSGGKNMNLLRRAKLILEPSSINAHAPFRTLALIAAVGLLVSYGSFAYSAAVTTAMSELQDEDHDHDHQADHDHEHHDGQVVEVRRIQRDGQQGKKENVFVVEAPRSHNGDDEKDFRNHLAELLHRNEMGTVSHQELAQKLRELADHLESGNNRVRSARNVRRNVEKNYDRPVEAKRLQFEEQLRRVKVGPREKPVIIDRETFKPREKVVPRASKNDARWRIYDGGDESTVRREKQKPKENVQVWEVEVDRDLEFVDEHDKDLPFGNANSTGGELGQVLRELKTEVQQLRREVNRLKSDRNSPPRDESRDNPRRSDSDFRNEFKRRVDVEAHESEHEGRSEFRIRRRDDQGSDDKAQAGNVWIESPLRRVNENEAIELKWVKENPDDRAIDFTGDVEEVELIKVEGKKRKSNSKR